MYAYTHKYDYTLPSCAGEDEPVRNSNTDDADSEPDAPIHAGYAKVVEEAIRRKGEVVIEVSKMVFLGAPEDLKAQLKYALMGKYEKSTNSTPLSWGGVSSRMLCRE